MPLARTWLVVASGCLVAALGIIGVGEVSVASAQLAPRCEACRRKAVRHLLRAHRQIDCSDGIPAADERSFGRTLARAERRLERCGRRRGCTESTPHALPGSLREVASAVEARTCAVTLRGGDPIDPRGVQGPVGVAPAAVDPATAPSLDDVGEHCRLTMMDSPPPLLALPDVAELPDWCSEEEAYLEMVARCGPPRVVVVAAEAEAAAATGSPEHPYSTIAAALQACATEACHVLVAPGTYAEAAIHVPGCAFIEGGVALSDGTLMSGGARPRIEGQVMIRGFRGPVTLARVEVEDAYGALSPDGDVLVTEAVLRGVYEGGSSAFEAMGPRVCRSHVSGGYAGIGLAWHSSRLWVAGSAIAACHVGVDLSWGSRNLKILKSVVYGDYVALDVNWGSTDAEVHRSRIGSRANAVNILVAADEHGVFPATFDVTVTGNRIHSGALPRSDPELNIVIEDNVRE